MLCWQCKEEEAGEGFGNGPNQYRNSQEVHRGVTCEEVEAMEW